MSDNRDLKQKIVNILDEHSEGLSILEISELVGHHRHTVTKYIHELIGAGIIFQRDMGTVKLHYLASRFPEKERQLLEKLTKRVKK
jgi:predicted transcriptional regulator